MTFFSGFIVLFDDMYKIRQKNIRAIKIVEKILISILNQILLRKSTFILLCSFAQLVNDNGILNFFKSQRISGMNSITEKESLNAIKLNVIKLNVIKLNVVILLL